jgi:hypothetical protein
VAAPLVKDRVDFFPGEAVPESGVYFAIHDGHREPHLISAIKLEIFPECRKCRGRVRFRQYLESLHMTHDWDLSGPSLELLENDPLKK